MKILAFSDSHIRDCGSFAPFNVVEENGLTRELNNILAGFEFVAGQIIKTKPKVVFFCGDFFHHRDTVSGTVLHAAGLAISWVVDACTKVRAKFYMIPGNHDVYSDLLGINHLSIINGDETLEVIHDDRNLVIDKFRIGIVQFNSDKSKVMQSLEKACQESDLIITHLDFEGATYETGIASKSVISPILPIPVISGDIHAYQILSSVHYIGSLVQNRFNRSDFDKVGGVLIYDTVTKKFEHQPNTRSKHYIKVEKLDQLKAIGPEQAVFQIRCPVDDDDLNKLSEEGYEFVYIPFLDKGEEQQQGVILDDMESPERILRKHLEKIKPESLTVFDRIMGISNQ